MQTIDDRRIRGVLQRTEPNEAVRAVMEMIPEERLDHNPWAAPVGLDPESMAQLTEEIFTYGVREALLGRSLPGDRYQILMGGRTLEAARRIGERTLPVIVADLSEEAAITIALADALTRERLSPWEVAEGLAEYIETLGELGQDTHLARVAAVVDHTEAWVERLCYIAECLSPEVLEQAGVSVHDMNVLSEEQLLRAAEPSDPSERAQRLREIQAREK